MTNRIPARAAMLLVAITSALFLSAVVVEAQSPVQTALPAADAPAALVTAIDAYGESNIDGTYLKKDCSKIATDGSDAGKYCWALLELSDTTASVSYAPANADSGDKLVSFRKNADGTWAAGTAPSAPTTGSGIAGGDSAFPLLFAALLLLGAGAFGAGVSAWAVRGRLR